MQIICAGFPKTGTKSMAKALRELGYVVHDFEEHVDLHMQKYLDFFEGIKDSTELMEAYRDVDAVTDQPADTMWHIFFKHYPDAKVILMERESADHWHKSYTKMADYYIDNVKVWYEDYMHLLSPTQEKWRRFTQHCMVRSAAMFVQFWRKDMWSKECWIYQYEMHNAAVKQLVPTDQLLVYQMGEGWERLCEFLDKPVPDMPFPRENFAGKAGNIVDQLQEFKTMTKIQREVRRGKMMCAGLVGVSLAVAVLYWKPSVIKSITEKLTNANIFSKA